MGSKINIQDLSDGLSARSGLQKKETDAFVRQFFDIIIAGIEQNQLVKVKGLGTFKMVDVQDRESVDVNTGKRIIINGHTKLTFTPDNALRDQVNKPFIDFETVILNDKVDLAAMERVSDDAGEGDIPEQEEESSAGPSGIEQIAEKEPDTIQSEPTIQSEASEEEMVAEEEQEQAPQTPHGPEEMGGEEQEDDPVSKEESAVDEPLQEQPVEAEEATPAIEADDTTDAIQAPTPAVVTGQTVIVHKENKCHPAVVALKWIAVLLLVAGSYVAGYHRVLPTIRFVPVSKLGKADANPAAPTPAPEPVPVAVTDTVPADTATVPAPVSTPSPAPIISIERVAGQYPQVEGGKYLIIGTKATHEMGVGDNLYKLARATYGSNKMVEYIVVYNRFSNPDVIPPGYLIKLPELRERKDME